jgi:hypothetical protein
MPRSTFALFYECDTSGVGPGGLVAPVMFTAIHAAIAVLFAFIRFAVTNLNRA